MKAGRALDALVAEKVMGYYWVDVPKDYDGKHAGRTLVPPGFMESAQSWPNRGPVPSYYYCKPYSTNIVAAWEALGKLQEMPGFGLVDIRIRTGSNVAIMTDHGNYMICFAVADTAPLAICLAALKAVEARHALAAKGGA